MTAEDFNKMAIIDGIKIMPVVPDMEQMKFTGGYHYMENLHCNVNISIVSTVYKYPDHYKVQSRNYNPIEERDGFDVDLKTEEEAYKLLYKILYKPDTLTWKDLHPYEIQDAGWITNMSPEEFAEARKELKKLDKEIAETDELTKGEKFFYKVLRGITKIVGL